MRYKTLVVAANLIVNWAFANVDTPSSTSDANKKWAVSAQLVYLQPMFSGGSAYLDDSLIGTQYYVRNALQPDWGPGFKIEGSYFIKNNYDLTLNWYHYNKTSQGSYFYLSSTQPDFYTIKPEWNAVNIELGMRYGRLKNIRFLGGLHYAQVKSKYNEQNIDVTTGLPGGESYTMQYSGVGPRIGAAFSYPVRNNLSLYANGATALLAGTSKFNDQAFYTPPQFYSGKKLATVSEVEVMLGIKYNCSIASQDLTVDIGYSFINYFSILNRYNASTQSNFALNGPYLGIKWAQ